MTQAGRVSVGIAVGILLAVTAARADILVMEGPNGRMLITNQGQRSGYKVISRHREFFGSSGMEIYASVGGDPSKYEDAVRETANKYALEPSLVKAVIRAESNFQPMAVSPKGAMGLVHARGIGHARGAQRLRPDGEHP